MAGAELSEPEYLRHIEHLARSQRVIGEIADTHPVVPLPAQVVLSRQGWVTPMTLSPFSARRLGVSRPAYWPPEVSG